jgi:uncharacterized protein (TIGR02147 family)
MSSNRSIFSYLSYISFIKNQIKSNQGIYGYKAQLAEAAGCQRSFISQVLTGKVHLTHEHAIGLALFWNLSTTEHYYFVNLVLLGRTGSKRIKDHLLKKLEQARRDQENLVKRIENKTVLPEHDAAIFYSGWQYLAVNILLTIAKYRNVKAIAQRFEVSEAFVLQTLKQLEKLALVSNVGDGWVPVNNTIHVPRDSQFNTLNHSNWRQRAMQNSFLAREEDIHYTSVCSISAEDFQKIRQLMFSLIDDSRKIISPSPEEELYCLTCDWFKV